MHYQITVNYYDYISISTIFTTSVPENIVRCQRLYQYYWLIIGFDF